MEAAMSRRVCGRASVYKGYTHVTSVNIVMSLTEGEAWHLVF